MPRSVWTKVNPAGAIDAAYGTNSMLEFDPLPAVAFKDHGLAVQPRQFSHGYHNKQAMDVALDSQIVPSLRCRAEQTNGGPTDVLVARTTTDGTVDASFGTAGVTVIDGGSNAADWPTAVGVDSADQPVVTGAAGPTNGQQNQFAIGFTAAGALDTAFGTNGSSTKVFGAESHIPEDIAFGPGAVYISGLRQGANVFGGFVSKVLTAGGGAPWP